MKNIILDNLRDLLRNSFELAELECILSDSETFIISAFSDILREKFQNLTVDELCKKHDGANRIKNIALDVLSERVRKAIDNRDFYEAWKLDICELFKTAQKDVLNEYNYIKKLDSLSVFLCHFTKNDDKATDVKSFLEFYGISTFVDHEDSGNFTGEIWKLPIENELRKRPIFLVLAVDEPPTPNIKKEIDLDETLSSNDRLRANLILEPLTKKSNGLKIDPDKQYIKYYEFGIEKSYNYLLNSILKKFKIWPNKTNT